MKNNPSSKNETPGQMAGSKKHNKQHNDSDRSSANEADKAAFERDRIGDEKHTHSANTHQPNPHTVRKGEVSREPHVESSNRTVEKN